MFRDLATKRSFASQLRRTMRRRSSRRMGMVCMTHVLEEKKGKNQQKSKIKNKNAQAGGIRYTKTTLCLGNSFSQRAAAEPPKHRLYDSHTTVCSPYSTPPPLPSHPVASRAMHIISCYLFPARGEDVFESADDSKVLRQVRREHQLYHQLPNLCQHVFADAFEKVQTRVLQQSKGLLEVHVLQHSIVRIPQGQLRVRSDFEGIVIPRVPGGG